MRMRLALLIPLSLFSFLLFAQPEIEPKRRSFFCARNLVYAVPAALVINAGGLWWRYGDTLVEPLPKPVVVTHEFREIGPEDFAKVAEPLEELSRFRLSENFLRVQGKHFLPIGSFHASTEVERQPYPRTFNEVVSLKKAVEVTYRYISHERVKYVALHPGFPAPRFKEGKFVSWSAFVVTTDPNGKPLLFCSTVVPLKSETFSVSKEPEPFRAVRRSQLVQQFSGRWTEGTNFQETFLLISSEKSKNVYFLNIAVPTKALDSGLFSALVVHDLDSNRYTVTSLDFY